MLCHVPIRYIAEAMRLIGNSPNHSGIIHSFCQVYFDTAPKKDIIKSEKRIYPSKSMEVIPVILYLIYLLVVLSISVNPNLTLCFDICSLKE